MMSIQPTDQINRRFEFDAPEAVARSRANARFISCPVCRADTERYLFHERGARFVQCRSCDTVFVNPQRASSATTSTCTRPVTQRSRTASTSARG